MLSYDGIDSQKIGFEEEEEKGKTRRRLAQLINIYNIKRSCVFLQLNGINLGNFCPADIFHDVAEGFLTYEMLNVIRLELLSPDMSIETICDRLQSFSFYHGKAMVFSYTKKCGKNQKDHPMIRLQGIGIQKT